MANDSNDDWGLEDEPESVKLEYEILNYPADTTLAGYLELSANDRLEVPPFQRNFVWDQVKASRLIESFLIGLPVPGVFLYKKRDSADFQVIDGHQRISSVVSYLKGYFGERRFRLKGVAEKWEGKAFEDLSEQEQFKLNQSVMRSTIIQQLDPNDDTSIYMIFERLNTGGVNLNPMEVRRCVFHGEFIDFLDELNGLNEWQACLGRKEPDKRYRDVEIVLKVLAMHENGENYEKPAKGFLNEYINENRDRIADEQILDSFSNACKIALEALGEKPFHLRGRINQAAVDSIVSTLMHANTSPGKQAFDSLFEDPDFILGTTRNTSDQLEVGLRLAAAARHLL